MLQKCRVGSHISQYLTMSNPFIFTARCFQFACISKMHKLRTQKHCKLSLTVILHEILLYHNSWKIRFRHTGVGTDNRIKRHASACPSYCIFWIQVLRLFNLFTTNMYTTLQNLLSIPKMVNKPMLSHMYSGTAPMLQGQTLFSQMWQT